MSQLSLSRWGDLNLDGSVNSVDMKSAVGNTSDLNLDQKFNAFDMAIIAANSN
jgi:hypothetical protein